MQNDVRAGIFPVKAGEDLTGKEDYLVVLSHTAGVPEVNLPTAITDHALYVLISAGTSGAVVSVAPLSPEKTYRVPIKGGCNPGDRLCLADVSVAADKGKVRAVPEDAGDYRTFARAESLSTDGNLAKIRPAGVETITVAG